MIIYLRARQRDSLYKRAFLIDHPLRRPGSTEYSYRVDVKLGRETKPFRQVYQELLDRLRAELRDPLIDTERKTAFDHLVAAWSEELGAMSYAESFKVLDLMLMVSILENRKLLDEANDVLREHGEALKKLTGE